MRRLITMASVIVVLASCSPAGETVEESIETTAPPASVPTTTAPPTTTTTQPPDFAASSPAFGEGERIPAEFTCDGADDSPELEIVGLPVTTRAIAIIVEDPDAPLGLWYHWVEFDIPATGGSHVIERAAGRIGISGLNSWNLEGYMGPCPPEGDQHRYVFRIHALDSMLGLPAGVEAPQLIEALDDATIDTIELTGTYSR